jgi:hypothetical protein
VGVYLSRMSYIGPCCVCGRTIDSSEARFYVGDGRKSHLVCWSEGVQPIEPEVAADIAPEASGNGRSHKRKTPVAAPELEASSRPSGRRRKPAGYVS